MDEAVSIIVNRRVWQKRRPKAKQQEQDGKKLPVRSLRESAEDRVDKRDQAEQDQIGFHKPASAKQDRKNRFDNALDIKAFPADRHTKQIPKSTPKGNVKEKIDHFSRPDLMLIEGEKAGDQHEDIHAADPQRLHHMIDPPVSRLRQRIGPRITAGKIVDINDEQHRQNAKEFDIGFTLLFHSLPLL